MRKILLTTNSIVLKRINFKDTDKILTIYTSDFGKISAIAKGLRKISSKKLGSLEPFTISKIQLSESFGMYIVGQTSIIKSFSGIKTSYEKIATGLYILEVFDKLVPDHQPNLTLFKFLSKTIYIYSQSNVKMLMIVNAYTIKLLKMLGFYSTNEIKSKGLHDLAYNLESKTYEEINKIDYSESKNKQLQRELTNMTESITETKFKTLN